MTGPRSLQRPVARKRLGTWTPGHSTTCSVGPKAPPMQELLPGGWPGARSERRKWRRHPWPRAPAGARAPRAAASCSGTPRGRSPRTPCRSVAERCRDGRAQGRARGSTRRWRRPGRRSRPPAPAREDGSRGCSSPPLPSLSLPRLPPSTPPSKAPPGRHATWGEPRSFRARLPVTSASGNSGAAPGVLGVRPREASSDATRRIPRPRRGMGMLVALSRKGFAGRRLSRRGGPRT